MSDIIVVFSVMQSRRGLDLYNTLELCLASSCSKILRRTREITKLQTDEHQKLRTIFGCA